MTASCPSCGATSEPEDAYPTGPPAGAPDIPTGLPKDQVASASTLGNLVRTLLAPLWAIVHNTAPLKPDFFRNYSVTAGNLPIGTGPNGPNVLKLSASIPKGCRGFLLRNLSATGIVTYWYTDTASPVNATDFQTVPAASAIAQDVAPTNPSDHKPGLTISAQNVSDAQVEVAFYV